MRNDVLLIAVLAGELRLTCIRKCKRPGCATCRVPEILKEAEKRTGLEFPIEIRGATI